ncbi:MAG TPA: transglycosylase family protein [Solirubrobacteraceae bacterium]|nr:transglycosylase family protein [Solirubrobacteraceae bacterium]
MRLRSLGAVCASCAVAASTSTAVAQSPTPTTPAATLPAKSPGDLTTGAKRQLIDRHMFMARTSWRLRGDPLTRIQRSRKRAALHAFSLPRLRLANRRVARDLREARAEIRERRHGGAPNVPIPAVLRSIAMCESRGNPRAISSGGTYRGKYQFSFSTWASVGGKGDPAAASETEQDRRAAILYRTGGPGHWPVCGR